MTNIILKPNNTPTKPGFYLVHRPKHGESVFSTLSATVIQNDYYNSGDLYLFLGEVSMFPLKEMEEDCLWSDEIILKKENN